jgi:glycogen phosphorylase
MADQAATGENVRVEDDRTGLSTKAMTIALKDNLYFTQGKYEQIATKNDWYMALAYTIRDRLVHRWINTVQHCVRSDVRKVCYLSAEFLTGPHLANALVNLDLYDQARKAVEQSGYSLEELIAQEEEPGLGNGGLGRLAACYMDSLSTLDIPARGYGIRYQFGIFDQEIRDGWQVEVTDNWLHYGNPWEIRRPEVTMTVKLGGYTQQYKDDAGRFRVRWVPDRVVNGVPYDTAVPGYQTMNANTLRLWSAEAHQSFDFQAFNTGDYMGAVKEKISSENISKVLYPNDDSMQGKQLRLEQQYFFVSCSLQDIIRVHTLEGEPLDNLHEKFAVQLNDTHPSIAIAEMMRLLVDEHNFAWDDAWFITRNTFAYTNHTLLPEALERWSIPLFKSVLPRHLEIIYEINNRFLQMVREKYPNDEARISRMSLIDESGDRFIRMAHLACVGSHAINGVAALHTELLKRDVLHDFYELWPEKFLNVTNGVTPRRWMAVANPSMTKLISSKIGESWLCHLDELTQLEKSSTDAAFVRQWRDVKQANKRKLAEYIYAKTNIVVDASSMYDVQVKRIHEYKRQHLNLLHIITLYNRIKRNPSMNVVPRTFIFGGKAAPGYFMAKLIVKLINSIADVVNNDTDVGGRLKVVFVPDFNVTTGQYIYPAADLSEQISTAGKEASGTGNMKFSLNGALTIGTLDGANVEMREFIGAENFFLFGLTADQVIKMKADGYQPRDFYHTNEELRTAIDQLSSGYFSRGDGGLFRPIVESLLNRDDFMLLADYQSYIDCQNEVSEAYRNQEVWARKSIINVARMGYFSSDRSVQEYADKIWKIDPIRVCLMQHPL